MSRLIALLALAMIALAGCGQNDTVGLATATIDPASQAETSEETPTEEPTASPSPTPSPAPEARAPEIVAFNVVETDFQKVLMVRLSNPNEGVGLIRTGFELTAVAEDGTIIDVYGTEGVPGAACCTIYRLPPGGEFGLNIPMDPGAAVPTSLELAITGRWVDWSSVEPPESELSDVTVTQAEFSGPSLSGRVTTPAAAEEGPFNILVVGFVQSPHGLLVISDSVSCVATADARAFSIDSFLGGIQGPYTLESAVAYTTTVPGVTEPAPGC